MFSFGSTTKEAVQEGKKVQVENTSIDKGLNKVFPSGKAEEEVDHRD